MRLIFVIMASAPNNNDDDDDYMSDAILAQWFVLFYINGLLYYSTIKHKLW